jgi:hypothetical protein
MLHWAPLSESRRNAHIGSGIGRKHAAKRPRSVFTPSGAIALPLLPTAGLAAFALYSPVARNPRLLWSFLGVSTILFVWNLALLASAPVIAVATVAAITIGAPIMVSSGLAAAIFPFAAASGAAVAALAAAGIVFFVLLAVVIGIVAAIKVFSPTARDEMQAERTTVYAAPPDLSTYTDSSGLLKITQTLIQATLPEVTSTDAFPTHRDQDGLFVIQPKDGASSPHLMLTYEDWDGAQFDVYFTQSSDGGSTWTRPARVNDNAVPAATDQFQPSVAEGLGGAVAVAFYDRRATCPDDPSVLPADVGRANFCLDVSVQAYQDSGQGAQRVGANVRASAFSWDPQNPAQHVGGLGQMACASHDDPCSLSFIGDYFGLAVSGRNVYVFAVSTHYPSSVPADEGGPVYYQQQVLSTLSRTALGLP